MKKRKISLDQKHIHAREAYESAKHVVLRYLAETDELKPEDCSSRAWAAMRLGCLFGFLDAAADRLPHRMRLDLAEHRAKTQYVFAQLLDLAEEAAAQGQCECGVCQMAEESSRPRKTRTVRRMRAEFRPH